MVAKFELPMFFLLEIYLNCPPKNRQIFHINFFKKIIIIYIIFKLLGIWFLVRFLKLSNSGS